MKKLKSLRVSHLTNFFLKVSDTYHTLVTSFKLFSPIRSLTAFDEQSLVSNDATTSI